MDVETRKNISKKREREMGGMNEKTLLKLNSVNNATALVINTINITYKVI